ncbi:MAG TPA: hypothetical protein VGM98_03535 [Schlesneria sp.]
MITWSTEQYRDPSQRRLAGESDTQTDLELLNDLTALWTTLFSDQLTWYARDRWNSLIAGVQVWHGTISIIPTVDLDLKRQLLGCRLYLSNFHAEFEGTETEEQTDAITIEQQSKFVDGLMRAFEMLRTEPAMRQLLDVQPIPFQILIEPDDPPVMQTVLQ